MAAIAYLSTGASILWKLKNVLRSQHAIFPPPFLEFFETAYIGVPCRAPRIACAAFSLPAMVEYGQPPDVFGGLEGVRRRCVSRTTARIGGGGDGSMRGN